MYIYVSTSLKYLFYGNSIDLQNFLISLVCLNTVSVFCKALDSFLIFSYQTNPWCGDIFIIF